MAISHGSAPSNAEGSEEQGNEMKSSRNQPLKRLFSLPEAAVYLGRSTWSVRRLIWGGELQQVRTGRRVHVDIEDMEEFIEKHKIREQ